MKRGSIMFCPKCGAQVPDGSPFCASCGAQLGQQQAPTNQGGFGQPTGNAGGNKLPFDLNPANMIQDFIAFFKKPSATIQQIIGWAAALLMLIIYVYLGRYVIYTEDGAYFSFDPPEVAAATPYDPPKPASIELVTGEPVEPGTVLGDTDVELKDTEIKFYRVSFSKVIYSTNGEYSEFYVLYSDVSTVISNLVKLVNGEPVTK